MSCFSLFTGGRWKCRFRRAGAMDSARQLATSSSDQELPRLCWLALSIEPGCHQTWPNVGGGEQGVMPSCPAGMHTHTCTHTHRPTDTQPYAPLSGTRRVAEYQKKHSPTHTHPDHQTSFINFLHLLRSIASSVFSLRAWQSSLTTSLQVLFGLPLGLGPATLYSMHFFTQLSSSFRTQCPAGNGKQMMTVSTYCLSIWRHDMSAIEACSLQSLTFVSEI